jgi:16S rRNA (cytidine1402-2'-O)-methyltransferase
MKFMTTGYSFSEYVPIVRKKARHDLKNQTGMLYIVATPIGNYADITLRAIEILKTVDVIICEDTRHASTLLKKLDIQEKELIVLDEHNEQEKTADLIIRLHQNQTMALISDAGTPVFADPGHYLISQAIDFGIPVSPIPGPSSLMAALSVLPFKLEKYIFGGFLPRDPDQRRKELFQLRSLRVPVVLMDTPYRLGALLDDVAKVFGKGQKITLAADLTTSKETIYRGSVGEVRGNVQKRKAEFILIVHGPPTR